MEDVNEPLVSSLEIEHNSQKSKHGFSLWVAVAFTTNYIMGCGFLGIPSATVQSGLILGPIVIVVFGVIMNMSKDFMLESLGRTEAITRLSSKVTAAVSTSRSAEALENTISNPEQTDYLVSEREFEVTDIFFLFFGVRARTLYMTVLSLYLYGGLWAYSTVFASSFAANAPVVFMNGGQTCNIEEGSSECINVFFVWLGVFAILAVPLSCLELKEQVIVQVIMFLARVLVVLLMAGTALGGYSCNGTAFAQVVGGKQWTPAPLFAPSGLSQIMPVSIYAFIFHHSVPILSRPVADKTSLKTVFSVAFLIVGTAYAGLGVALAAYFGGSIDGQCNLNWRQYIGCVPDKPDGSKATLADRSTVAQAISFVVLIFPALDVLSAFPLNAVTLGNNLMSAFYGVSDASSAAGFTEDVPSSSTLFRRRILFRLLAAIPPIIAGALSTYYKINLSQILQFTGLIGVAIAFGIPAVLRAWTLARHSQILEILASQAFKISSGAESAEKFVQEALSTPLSIRAGLYTAPSDLSIGIVKTPYTSRFLNLGRVDFCLFAFAIVIGLYVAIAMIIGI
jgi:hypothetical protein